ncbi:esterase/lipase family protein [Streptomyces sp. NPDC059701]|uniref:esterase/lipase family protein n=1 Tax=Streptomyces sp. NPDC059701 TaxID=3346914 RepID=UPI0036BA4FD9
MSQTQKIPVIYVQGFAGGQSGIDSAVMDPFLGFNAGSTHVRIGPDNKPSFYQLESPLLRLMVDEGYQLLVHGSQETYLDAHPEIPAASIWIHRFYDPSASTWGGTPKEFRLEDAAKDLLELIEELRAKAHVDRVHLIAHSMGGLICRCLIQKVLPERGIEPTAYVDKLFTYGTPHGGIAFDLGFGLLERLRDAIGINGAEIFGRERMYQYLTPGATAADEPPDHWDPRAMPADGEPFAFSHRQVFCLIGTAPGDYDVAHGLSSAAVGPRSDGLVQIDNAYVPGAYYAYVHRSHSGRYGLVNSEEGYQNLRRFLFGDLKVDSALVHVQLPEEKNTAWQAEVRLSIRGLQIVMHERTSAQWCPIQLGGDAQPGADGDANRTAGEHLPVREPGQPERRRKPAVRAAPAGALPTRTGQRLPGLPGPHRADGRLRRHPRHRREQRRRGSGAAGRLELHHRRARQRVHAGRPGPGRRGRDERQLGQPRSAAPVHQVAPR